MRGHLIEVAFWITAFTNDLQRITYFFTIEGSVEYNILRHSVIVEDLFSLFFGRNLYWLTILQKSISILSNFII
jgi:hypothetical protein